MKTIAYIDGGNLYYGLLRGRPATKWLDLFVFTQSLLDSKHELVAVKYFTATTRIKYGFRPSVKSAENVMLPLTGMFML